MVVKCVVAGTHMHMISASSRNNLSDIVRDFKKFTCSILISKLKEVNDDKSNTWLNVFKKSAASHKRNKNYQLWQHNNHAEEVYSSKFTLSKIKYIHNNPVEAGLVDITENYLFSSAVDYAGGKSPVNISLINLHNLYY